MNNHKKLDLGNTASIATTKYINNGIYGYFGDLEKIEITKEDSNLYLIKNLSIGKDSELLLWILNRKCIINEIGHKQIMIKFENTDDSVEFYLTYKGYERNE